jgi:hypothetical protein
METPRRVEPEPIRAP